MDEPGPARGASEMATEAPSRTAKRIGQACLGVAVTAAGVLAWAHLRLGETPGCGAGGGCAAVLESWWAELPVLRWPIAFVGLAYFSGLLAAWLATGGRLGRSLRRLTWVGGAVTVALVGVMAGMGTFCPWCLAVHTSNLAFVAVAARSGIGRSAPWCAGGSPFSIVFLIVFAGLAALDGRREVSRNERWEAQRLQSERAIANASKADREEPAGFTGRYRLGPPAAAIRIVIFFDYQCPLCREIDNQAEAVLRGSALPVSVSFRHFPHCRDCNPAVRGEAVDLHPNACRAARAAETAGVLGDEPAFFAVHRWLMRRGGAFGGVEQLREVIERAGLDWRGFVDAFGSARVLANLEADVQEAVRLGLLSTPMVYVNGVEMKGITAPEALVRTVQGVAVSHPEVRTAAADRPPSAREKALADWEEGPIVEIPGHRRGWTRDTGLVGAVDVVVWGDYGDSESRALDRWLRRRLAADVALRYTFRHAPANASGHEAALAAEAAGRLGHDVGFWAVHAWLMGSEGPLNIERLLADLAGFGVDGETFLAAMRDPATAVAVREDLHTAESFGLPGPPLVLVEGRWVPRWRLGDEVILDRILEHAAAARRGLAEPTQPAPPTN